MFSLNQTQYDTLFNDTFEVFSYAYLQNSQEIMFINGNLCELLGISQTEYQGKTCEQLLGGHLKPCVYPSGVVGRNGELFQWVADCEKMQKQYSMKAREIPHEKGTVSLVYGVLISEELAQLRSSHNLDKAIITCAETLLDNSDMESAIETLLSTVAEFHDAERAYIFEIDMEHCSTSNTYEVCRFQAEPKIHQLQNIQMNVIPTWLEQLRNQACISLDRVRDKVADDSPEGKMLREQGVDSLLLVPIKKQDVMTGFIGVSNPKYACDHPELLMTVSAFVFNDIEKRTVTMELCNTVNDLQKSLDMSEIMFQCAKILLNDSNTNIAISHLLETIAHYVGADSAYVFEYDKKERLLKNNHFYSNHGSTVPSDKTKNVRSMLNQIHLSPHLGSTADTFFSKDYIPLRNREKMEDKESWEYIIFSTLNSSTCIMAPFQKNGNFCGFLGLDNPKTNFEHKEVITTVSAFIVNTLEKRGMMNQLEFLSFSDELTGLKNRNAYLHKIKEYRRQDLTDFGVIFADINDLKSVNDCLGHEVGDQLILWCVKFLQSYVRDTVYRIGGDEFVCFVSGISQECFEERIASLRKAEQRMKFRNLAFGSVWSAEVEDLDDEIFDADQEMYGQKELIHVKVRENPLSEKEKREEIQKRIDEINRVKN